MIHPVIKAIEPLRADAQDAAEAAFRGNVQRVLDLLAQADWNLNVVAPGGHSRMTRANYMQAQAWRGLVTGMTQPDKARATLVESGYRLPDPERVERLVQGVREDAASAFDAFGAKLVAKVGEDVTGASIEARSGVWVESTLTVLKGEVVERWRTKRIINCSVLGKLFHQWPTRQVA